ncbi:MULTISPECIES: PAS domain-containing sensor histidine kinase [unclassified Corallococcus]|uniref:PAS domain-containing sensor histidine kinase n=1 Tax=unclassified Corallococcus TaxID=2685029 RepID=UPI001A8F5D2A|nr:MULTISPECIES: PAS domain-containing protein [unclassified Corallococcus]MBN9687556.1 PAS domain-containing protein [Corallococcus sp. NCSPR001]WAS88623.1 PAS domain-containing protein [Corallococcus sp. NCRR]
MAVPQGQERTAPEGPSSIQALDALERISDAVFALDRSWRFTYLNTSSEWLLRRPRQELLGRDVWDEFPEARGSIFEQEYQRALREQVHVAFEAYYEPLDAWLDVRAYPSSEGLTVCFRDVSPRKRFEHALHESEKFLRSTLDSLSTHIAILDGRGAILAVNAAWKRFASDNGCADGDVRCGVGANYLEVTEAAQGENAEEAAAVAQGIRDILAGRSESFLLDYPCHAPAGGQRRWFLLRATRFVGSGPLRVVMAHEDITARHEADEARNRLIREEAAREEAEAARERLNAVLERITDGFAAFDRDGRFTYVNRTAETHFGLKREVLLGRRLEEVFSGDHGPAMATLVRRAAEAQRPVEEEQPSIVDNRWLRVVAYPSPEGLSVYFRDITEKRRVELWGRFLSDMGAASTRTLDCAEVVRTVVTLAVPTLADGCAIATRGGCLDEGPSTEVSAVTPGLADALRAACTPRAETPLGRTVEQALRTQSGARMPGPSADTPRVESAVAVPLALQDHSLGVLLLVSTHSGLRYGAESIPLVEELARRTALALENARLYRTAKQAVAARDETLGIVSHDLRAPLNTISLLSRSAERSLVRTHEEANAAEALRKVRLVVGNMEGLIDDLLEVARVESGHTMLDVEPLDVPRLLHQVQALNELLAADKALRLEVEAEPGLPQVRADRARLMRVFQNLVGNAIRFTPPGGRILLKAERRGEQVCFRVVDSGPGVDAQALPHVFDRFWQAIHTRKAGAGLGLAIVKGLVEAHGGRIWVESPPGHGAAFFFTLPGLPAASADQTRGDAASP